MDDPNPLAGRFRFHQRLPSSNKSAAWLAQDLITDTRVIVALLPTARARGLAPLVGVEHPHIARVFAVLENTPADELPSGLNLNGQALVVAERITGRTLTQQIEAGKIPPAEAVQLSLKLALALERAHNLGAVLGAISPRSVIVAREGSCPIFTHLVVPPSGAYCSPIRMQGGGPTTDDDVWALHGVFHTALARTQPFRGTTREELERAIASGDHVSLASRGVDDEQLAEIVQLGFHPENPTSQANQLVRALQSWLSAKSDVFTSASDEYDLLASPKILPSTPLPSAAKTEPPAAPRKTQPSFASEFPEAPPAEEATHESSLSVTPPAEVQAPAQPPFEGGQALAPSDGAPAPAPFNASELGFGGGASAERISQAEISTSPAPSTSSVSLDQAPPISLRNQGPASAAFTPDTDTEHKTASSAPIQASPALTNFRDPSSFPVSEASRPGSPKSNGAKWFAAVAILVGLGGVGAAIALRASQPKPKVAQASPLPPAAQASSASAAAQPSHTAPEGISTGNTKAAPPSAASNQGQAEPNAVASSQPSASAGPDAAAEPSSAAAAATEASQTPEGLRSCVASHFPEETFAESTQDFSFMCEKADPRELAKDIHRRIVLGGRGKVSAGMREWSLLAWYELAATVVIQKSCCSNAPPLSLPPDNPVCEALPSSLERLAGELTAESLDQLESNITCFFDKQVPRPYRYSARPDSGNKTGFSAFLSRAQEYRKKASR